MAPGRGLAGAGGAGVDASVGASPICKVVITAKRKGAVPSEIVDGRPLSRLVVGGLSRLLSSRPGHGTGDRDPADRVGAGGREAP